MKKFFANSVFFVLLAIVASAAFMELQPALYNFARFAAFLVVAISVIGCVVVVFVSIKITEGKALDRQDQVIAGIALKRTKRKSTLAALRAFAMTVSMVLPGWFFFAFIYGLCSLMIHGAFVSMKERLEAKAARDADV